MNERLRRDLQAFLEYRAAPTSLRHVAPSQGRVKTRYTSRLTPKTAHPLVHYRPARAASNQSPRTRLNFQPPPGAAHLLPASNFR